MGSVSSDRPEDKSYPRLPPNVTSVSQDTCKLYFFIPSFYSFLFFRVLFISFSKLYNSKLRDEKSFFFETGAYTQQVFELIQGITSVLNEPFSVIFGRLPPIPLCTITSTSFKHILMPPQIGPISLWFPFEKELTIREGVKKTFFWEIFAKCGWVGGWFPNKVQTPQNPPKSPWKSPFSTKISPFVFPNLTKTLGWMGG